VELALLEAGAGPGAVSSAGGAGPDEEGGGAARLRPGGASSIGVESKYRKLYEDKISPFTQVCNCTHASICMLCMAFSTGSHRCVLLYNLQSPHFPLVCAVPCDHRFLSHRPPAPLVVPVWMHGCCDGHSDHNDDGVTVGV
jgi:hypothetical protein